jgi:cephalosporin hydroxylase
MHIYYQEGPTKIGMGAAGNFVKGVSRDIDDDLAEQILQKKSIVFTKGESTAPTEAAPASPASAAKKKEVTVGN